MIGWCVISYFLVTNISYSPEYYITELCLFGNYPVYNIKDSTHETRSCQHKPLVYLLHANFTSGREGADWFISIFIVHNAIFGILY